jgi:hypothetical protein
MLHVVEQARPRDPVAYILAYNQYLRHAAKVMALQNQPDYDPAHLKAWRDKCRDFHDRLSRQAICDDGFFLLPEYQQMGRYVVPHPAIPMPITDREREVVFDDVPFIRVTGNERPFIYGKVLKI